MTKRIVGIAVAAAAAGTFLLPAAPAQAAGECWSWFTTPAECAAELVQTASPAINCVELGHTPVFCLPPAG